MTAKRPHIFVFGSNEAGMHGAGAAAHAKKYHGALWGTGEGFMGTCYALPTKSKDIGMLLRDEIQVHVERFLQFAKLHPEMIFDVTRVGCGLAGYTDEQIAPMFKDAPKNCHLPHGWRDEY